MKKTLLIVLCILSFCAKAQTIDAYFEHIRKNEAALSAFFSQMPKGGDLHNHFSGSVYTETYIDFVVHSNYYISKSSLEVREKPPKKATDFVSFSSLQDSGQLDQYKQKLLQKWSVKDYNYVSYPCDKQFFETFNGFGIANKGAGRLDTGLLELKRRAIKENVAYIETMFTGVKCAALNDIDTSYNHLLEVAEEKRDETTTHKLLEQLYQLVLDKNAAACVHVYNKENIADRHKRLGMDDANFVMRYQAYATRIFPPEDVFKSLVLCFMSANESPLVVGVNIVGPENNEVAMRDYWLHMQMFKFCHEKYPKVKYAMHAGELALGMVKPEELSWHINEAVHVAGANRIGHGVDMPYEQNCYDLLKYMADNKIPIEINLYSNEFILKVKDGRHPISLYKSFHVPIVISSDDAGVLRSSLTEQYVLLAKRYKDVSYADIKQYVYNSITYSFMAPELKRRLKEQLDERFAQFEKKVMEMNAE